MAVCANAAMQEYKERNGVVNLDIYLVKMDEELVCVSASYIFITETKVTGYCLHNVYSLSRGCVGPTLPPNHWISHPALG